MRKLTVVLAVFTLAFCFAACAGHADVSSQPASSVAESSEPAVGTTVTAEGEIPLPDRQKYDLLGSAADEKGWIYTLPNCGGLRIREATFDSGKGGEPAEIVQITDIHFNKLNDKDFEENNPSVMSTYKQRVHMANGASGKNARFCMNFASYFDQIVVTGDTLDYLTWGALEMVNDIIWKKRPDTLIALGNHEPVRVMGLGNDVADSTSLESRYRLLQENWKHDVYYTSKIIKDKAMVIQMDNSQGHFWDSQIAKLKSDIEKARQNGYVILLFVHIPLASNNPAEKSVMEISAASKNSHNFYSSGVKGEVWDVIMNNADVIGGVFSGHIHENYYSEMLAKTPSGEQKIIRQYVLAAAFKNTGYVLKVTVK